MIQLRDRKNLVECVKAGEALASPLACITAPHTQPGTTLRLKSQGLRDQAGHRGDLMAQIQTEIPVTIAPEIITAIQNHA